MVTKRMGSEVRGQRSGPVGEEFESIAYFLGRNTAHDSQEPSHLLADTLELLAADNDARMAFAPRQNLGVQPAEVSPVEAVYDAALCGRVRQVFVVLAFDHACFGGRLEVHAASAKRVDEVGVHRVFVDVEPYLHNSSSTACAARAARCSRSRRSASSSSAAISASMDS